MLSVCIAIGLAAGIAAQIMFFPATYEDYQRTSRDQQQRREFYRELIIDSLLIEAFFLVLSLVIWLAAINLQGMV